MKIDDRRLANWLVSIAVLLGMLVYGQPLLAPLAFALLLWAILNALKDALSKAGLPGSLAWVVSFVLIFAAIYAFAVVLANEAAAISSQVPVYSKRLAVLWTHFPYHEMVPMVDLPTLVQQYNLPGMVAQMAASLGNTLLEIVLILIFAAFLLVEQRHLPLKLVRLQRNEALRGEASAVIRAMGMQIQSYMGVCTFLSAVMALISLGTLTWLKVDFAGFWALVLFFATYIPTIGALMVILPALAALAQFGGPGPALMILVVLSVTHFILTNVVMTLMLGRSLNLSPFAIMIALTFWGMVWGIAGLFLAVPLVGAAAIICRHIDGLEWIAELIAGPPPRHWHIGKLRLGS